MNGFESLFKKEILIQSTGHPSTYFDSIISEEENFRRRVIFLISLTIGLLSLIALPIRHFIAPLTGHVIVAIAGCATLLLINSFLIHKKVATILCLCFLVLAFSTIGVVSGINNGGIRAPATVIFIITPIVGFFGGGKKGACFALLISILSIGFLLLAEEMQWVNPVGHSTRYSFYMSFIYIIASFIIFSIGAAYEKSRKMTEEIIKNIYVKSAQSAKMASLGEMSAGMAHEINNPLAIIDGLSSMLPELLQDPEKFQEKIEAIHRATNRISKIVSSLRKFSRTESNTVREACLLEKVAKEVIVLSELSCMKHEVKLVLESSSSSQILINEVEIEQVILNLVQNSIFAIKDLPEKWIKILIHEDAHFVILQVLDSGRGIPESIQNRLFEPFFTTKPVGEGTGLGLSISKGILDDHNASISIKTINMNTCFEICFKKMESHS